MKALLILQAAVCTLALAGCGGGGSGPIGEVKDACLASGDMPEDICECVASRAAEELSPEALKFLAATLSGDSEAITEMRGELGMESAAQVGMFMTQAPARCAAGLGDG